MKKNKGFTLIELIVAVALVTLLLGALGGVLVTVFNSGQKWETRSVMEDRVALLLNSLERDLLIEEPGTGLLPFEGRGERLELFSHRALRRDGLRALPGARRVIYQYSPSEGILERIEEPVLAKESRPESVPLATRLREFGFRFLGSDGWSAQWRGEKWPQAVAIEGVLISPTGEEVRFERKFFPISS